MANQWDRLIVKPKHNLTKVAQESFIAATQSIAFKSPVRDGFFKNSFFTVINGVSTKTTNTANKSGQERLDEARAKSLKIKTGDVITFVSNSPYGMKLEYGSSDQAPNGMIRITVAEWRNTVTNITKGIK